MQQSLMNEKSVKTAVQLKFQDHGIEIGDLEIRSYPGETIVIVRVGKSDLSNAIPLGNDLDAELNDQGFKGFVTIKESVEKKNRSMAKSGKVISLDAPQVQELAKLLNARSRTTEIQPSLEYIPEAKNFIETVVSPRHHLVFGRRGSGKTALLAEAKIRLLSKDQLAVWINMQTYRHETAYRSLLAVIERICDLVQIHFNDSQRIPTVLADSQRLGEEVQRLLSKETVSEAKTRQLIPKTQRLLRKFSDTADAAVFLFIDDFHYLERSTQPLFLDMLHGCVRDVPAWLKIATIQHLSRWFESSTQLGLQSGHDATIVDLDLTLQDPNAAKEFLEKVLSVYCLHCGISSLADVFSKQNALDRLVLASGAVPRDYLTLCSTSLQEARGRSRARLVGAQDVNKAAGDAKQRKLDELEDDAAATEGESRLVVDALQKIRRFCIDEKGWTYFRIDFRDKEQHMDQYGILQMLVDLRFVHLVERSLSDERQAGQRSEIYMLDLSQFAGQRLKRKLNVLDFADGSFVLKMRTQGASEDRIGDTPNRRLSLFRRSPMFELGLLAE